MEIKTPQELITLLEQVPLKGKEKLKLNAELANHTRRFFRAQIRAQRDIDGKAYAPRKRRQNRLNKNGKVGTRTNMLLGMSRNLKTEISSDHFAVGLVGLEGHIMKIHNEGKSVVYTRKINGWFNSKTNRWEGGNKHTKSAYKMPKRTAVGWTEKLKRELAQIIFKHMQPR